MAENKKTKPPKHCKEGEHHFIVTKWYTHGGKQKAVEMRCSHCLVSISIERLESKEWQENEF